MMQRSEVTKMICVVMLMLGLVYAGCRPADQHHTQAEVATAGLMALAAMSPIEAAGVLTEAGWDCLPYPSTRQGWHWTPPTTGAPVAFYRVRMSFDVADTMFSYWSTAICADESVLVAGVDSLGRMGLWSSPGVCR